MPDMAVGLYDWAVVADSEAEAEYQESLDKASKLLELMTNGLAHESVGVSGGRQ